VNVDAYASVWIQNSALLAAAVLITAAVSLLLHRCFNSAYWRRSIWQACTLTSLALAILQFTGGVQHLAELTRPQNRKNAAHLVSNESAMLPVAARPNARTVTVPPPSTAVMKEAPRIGGKPDRL